GSSPQPSVTLGPSMRRATGLTGSLPLNGWSVFDQAYNAVVDPSSTVPLIGTGQSMMAYRLGSGARIAVACDPGLTSLQGGPISASVAWDFVNQLLIPYTGTLNVGAGNTYNSSTGVVTLNVTGANLSPGDSVTVAGLAGTGSFASADGVHTTGPGTGGNVVTYTIATGLTMTINDSTGTIATGSPLSVTVLDVQASNCITVNYNSGTNTASWN